VTTYSEPPSRPLEDPVSNVLKWILLAVAVGSFALFAWATVLTYERAAPQPDRFVTPGGVALTTAEGILAGKAGFQKADLMDYGSLYGMGSYFGQDYTAFGLMRLAKLTEENLAQSRFGTGFDALSVDRQAAARDAMRQQLQTVDLTQREVVIPEALAAAIGTLRIEMANNMRIIDLTTGWTPAYSLDETEAAHTAEFLIYSALTTVARRPDTTWSWTENWPYEPEVGNTPTTNTFMWTWISFCFTFFAFGGVLFIYEFWLNSPDEGPMDPLLASFRPLTESQRKMGKYFLVVAAVLLLQILAGTIMAHAYYDRRSFYGLDLHTILPFNFLRDVHIQAPIIWIGVGWIGAGLFLAPAIAGGREARGQGLLVDILFWVTVIIVAGALIGNWLGIMGYMQHAWFWFGNQGLSYIQLGRAWQIGFFAGLLIWSTLMFRALWPTGEMLRRATRQFWSGRIRLENLIWAATLNIAVLYVFGMIPLTGIEKSFTINDFWRWWVVHLWVEQSFEFFAASMSAYLLMAVGLVSRQLAERAVYFQLILIFLGGVLGTGHHLYWAGGPSMWVPLGSMFSFIEVLPLGAADHRGNPATPAHSPAAGVQLPVGLHLHNRGRLLELRRRRRLWRRHPERAADQLLRARHLPDSQSRPYRPIRCLRAARDRPHLFLPALRDGRPRALRRSDRAVGVLALQWRACALDPAQLLPDRLAAARGCVRARSRLRPQRDVLRLHFVLAVDAASGRCRVRDRGVADGLGFYDQGAPAAASVGRALDTGSTSD